VLRQISFLIRFALPFFGSVPRGFNGNSEPQDNSFRDQSETAWRRMPVVLVLVLVWLLNLLFEVPL
jgi:hypothetical protein